MIIELESLPQFTIILLGYDLELQFEAALSGSFS